MTSTRTPRTYLYRIPLDDTLAMMTIQEYQQNRDDYTISQADEPNNLAHHGHVFYQSKERREITDLNEDDEYLGGQVPGLKQYQYSQKWEQAPFTLRHGWEMRSGRHGGTEIRGNEHIGTSNPRLPDAPQVTVTLPWTPGDIHTVYEDNEPVPDRRPRQTGEADPGIVRGHIDTKIRDAANHRLDELRDKLHDHQRECDHAHPVTTTIGETVAVCEDCGRKWYDKAEFDTSAPEPVGSV